MTNEYKKDFIINFLYLGCIMALILLVSKYVFAYIFPFIIGVVIAMAVQKPSELLSAKTKLKKSTISVMLTVLICIIVLSAMTFGLWMIGGRIMLYISKLPDYITDFQKMISRLQESISGNMKALSTAQKGTLQNAIDGAVSSFGSKITELFTGIVGDTVKSLPAVIIGSIVTVVASCYIAKDFDRLKRFTIGILSPDRARAIGNVKNIVTENTMKFIKGYGIISVVTFLELSVAFSLIGFSKPILKALLVSLIDALPVLGVGTVIIPWAIIEMLNRNFNYGVFLLITYAVVVIVRNFIEPKIIGSQININPVFTLISMFLGLKMSGFAGMILFPLVLTVIVEYYRKNAAV